jgi:hypothetical protein
VRFDSACVGDVGLVPTVVAADVPAAVPPAVELVGVEAVAVEVVAGVGVAVLAAPGVVVAVVAVVGVALTGLAVAVVPAAGVTGLTVDVATTGFAAGFAGGGGVGFFCVVVCAPARFNSPLPTIATAIKRPTNSLP